MSIQEHLNKIRNAIYGREVRESIAKGIETAYDDASEKDNANMEVKIARGTHPNLRSRLDETTAQLAEKPNKGEISVTDIDKNKGKFDQTYMSEEFLQQMAGNTPVNSVPADESITTEKLANRSVTEDKTTFFKKSTKNLLNPLTTKAKTKIETETDGREQWFDDVYAFYRASDFIEVTPNTQYVVNVIVSSVVYFDSTKKYIGSYYQPNYLPERILAGDPFTTPENAVYMRLNLRSAVDVNTIQVEKGSVVTDFEPYHIPPTYIPPRSIGKNKLEFDVLAEYATNADLKRVESKGSTNQKVVIPNNFSGWKLLDDSTNQEKWKFDSENSTTLGTVTEVNEVDMTNVPSNFIIPEYMRKPWLFSSDGMLDGLGDLYGNKMLKFEVHENGDALFHMPLSEREDFSENGELAFAVWTDSVSTDVDKTAKIRQLAYHSYPDDLTKFHQASDVQTGLNDGKGSWSLVTIPSIRKQSNPVIWIQRGSSPYGISTLETVDGIGFKIHNYSNDKKARFYVSGVFRIENTLDKGKLIIDFDDGFLSQYQEGFKYMYDTYGYKGNISIVGSWVEQGYHGQFPQLNTVTKEQMLEMQEAGWDMTSHTYSHINLGYDGYEPSFVLGEIQKNYEFLSDVGIKQGKRFLIYPEGSWNRWTQGLATQYHVMGRGTTSTYMQIAPTLRQFQYPCIDHAGRDMVAWRQSLQTLQDTKGVAVRLFHHIGSEDIYNPISVEKFRSFIDVIQEYDIDVITWSEFYDNYVVAE